MMKLFKFTLVVLLVFLCQSATAENEINREDQANQPFFETAPRKEMREDRDGILEADEYRVVSMNGGITRRPCPYTCEMRGIPREHCKEWKAALKLSGKEDCYVQDTRLPTSAIR